MKLKTTNFGTRFFGRCASVCLACTLGAVPAVAQSGGDDNQVAVTDYGTVTLAVQDTDLAQVLEMLSIQSQKNIITSKNVSATISANLFDVTFYEALDAILKVNGYDYIEDGNFIYIYTQEELAEIEAAQRRTESRIFEVQYLSASDANEFIAPLLSETGRSAYRGDVEPGIQPDISNAGADSYPYNAKLVVNDYPENLDAIAQLLVDLDTAPQQLLLEATILQTKLDESNAFGIDFAYLGSVDFTDLTNPLSVVGDILGGNQADSAPGMPNADNQATGIVSSVGQTTGAGGFKLGILRDDIAGFLKLLDEVTDSTVLARPKIMCLNRQRAEVLVGTKVGYISTTATETSTTEAVEFLDTGIRLNFRPFISPNGMIRLELAPSVSEAFLRTVSDAQGSPRTIPDEETQELTTNVRVQDRETIVLGGLFRESTTVKRRQVPFLGDIPIVGNAFRGQDDTVERDEIIFMITPSIVHDSDLWAAGKSAADFVQSVQVGSRQGLLGFSRERQTSMHNNDALEAFNRGDLDAALYHSNNSLRIAPLQPEMIKFREKILGTRESHHGRSMFQRIFSDALNRGAASSQVRETYRPMSSATPVRGTSNPTGNENDIVEWIESLEASVTEVDADVQSDGEPFAANAADDADNDASATFAAITEVTPESDTTWNADVAGMTADAATESSVDVWNQIETPAGNEIASSDNWTEPSNATDWNANEVVDDTMETATLTTSSAIEEVIPESVETTNESMWNDTPANTGASTGTFGDMNTETPVDMIAMESNDVVIDAMDDMPVMPDATVTDVVDAMTAMNPDSEMLTTEDQDRQELVDRFVHEYFASLGLEELSPFADRFASEDESVFPFMTFDDVRQMELMQMEPAQEMADADEDANGASVEVVEAENEDAPLD